MNKTVGFKQASTPATAQCWLTAIVVILMTVNGYAQVKIGGEPNAVQPGAVLELESTDKAFLLPRLTTAQMRTIVQPVGGMMVYNTDSNCLYVYVPSKSWSALRVGETTNSLNTAVWPYHSNDRLVGTEGNGKGVISLTGIGLTASGQFSHAEGKDAVAYGDYAWSSGLADTSSGTASVVFGNQNKATGAHSFVAGRQNTAAYQGAVVFGESNADTGWNSIAVGLQNRIYSDVSYSHVFGHLNELRGGSSSLLLGESNSMQSGLANLLSGYGNSATGNYQQIFGKSNQAVAGSSHFIAGENNIAHSGSANALIGFGNTASGNYLAAFGRDNSVFYQSAVAFGQQNQDSGFASIAGGLSNIIERDVNYSMSFGQGNLSTRNLRLTNGTPGAGTFTAGIGNVNSGFASTALGSSNRSTHLYGLAANYGNLSNAYAMSAFGHFNDTTASVTSSSFIPNEILFSIGNGTSNTARRNSFTMLRNGFTTINAGNQNGPNIPRAELDVRGTGAMIVPVGTSAQRPLAPVAGMIRLCTDCPGGPVLQGYDGTAWVNL
ncbi:MAG: hypothetical protein ACKO5C_09580 [Ferruginibacter sp.]